MDNIIKEAASGWLHENVLTVGGTNMRSLGDLLADVLVLIPKKTKHGLVSRTVHMQAKVLYDRFKDSLFMESSVILRGHSLGGGIVILIAQMLLEDGYEGGIHIEATGGLKVASVDVIHYLAPLIKSITWRVNYQDFVPYIGWWEEPIHLTMREGKLRKHFLDWNPKTHSSYELRSIK